MKTKYFLIYVAAGAAFLAVSLWLILTGGKNPRAVNAKYKLGGIMLIAWSVIATASCEKGPLANILGSFGEGQVMCYDPVSLPNSFYVSTDSHDKDWNYLLANGDSLTIYIENASYREFSISINKRISGKEGDEAIGELLLDEDFTLDEGVYSCSHKIEYSPYDEVYTGPAVVSLFGPADDNGTRERLSFSLKLVITSGEN